MVKRNCVLVALMVFCLVVNLSAKGDQKNSFPELKGPYLGQTPPGKKVELFDPGIFPIGESQGCSGFLRNGTVFVYTSQRANADWRLRPVYITEMKNGFWTRPTIAPFSNYAPYNFTVGPDDETIYFTSLRSADLSTRQLGEEANIWAVKMVLDRWTKPVMFGNSINTEKYYENYPAVTNNGTVYYMSWREEGEGRTDVWRSRKNDAKYHKAENLGKPVNSDTGDADPFVAPDESYLILCQKKEGGLGQYDLYIYFKKSDGSWTDPINMGPGVNSKEYEFRPYVTPDGKYLFFTSNREPDTKRGKIFWVSAMVIKDLKPTNLN